VSNINQLRLVIKREDHYELHFDNSVEFWSLDMKQKIDESKVHTYASSENGCRYDGYGNSWSCTL